MTPIPLKAKLYIASTVTLGAAIGIGAAWGWKPDRPWLLATLVALSALAALLKIRLPGVQGSSSVSYIVVIVAIVELNLAEVLSIAISGIVVQSYWRPDVRTRTIQTVFNAACVLNASAAAFLAFHYALAKPGGWNDASVRLLAAAATYFVVNTLSVSTIIGLTEKRSPIRVWRELYLGLFPYYLVGASVAGAIEHWKALLTVEFVLLMAPVAGALYHAMSSHVKRLNEGKLHAEEKAALHLETIEALELSKENAEEASRLKGQFLTNVSHELRTPMNAILGMTELALDTTLDEEQTDYLETVRNSAGALLAIINDILDVADMQSTQILINPVDCDVRVVLEEVISSMAAPARAKRLALDQYVDACVPNSVRVDPARIRQILVNIVGNAIKFTDMGSVSVRLALDSVDAALRFVVRDTGIGIAKEQQARIFEAFTQADGSMTRRHGGAGLGLALSACLAEMMGGRIWVDSEVGCGSVFQFTVKLEAGAHEEQQVAIESRHSSQIRRSSAFVGG
jgi:signal transduction histidine kinase